MNTETGVPSGMRQIRVEDDYETRWILVGPLNDAEDRLRKLFAPETKKEP